MPWAPGWAAWQLPPAWAIRPPAGWARCWLWRAWECSAGRWPATGPAGAPRPPRSKRDESRHDQHDQSPLDRLVGGLVPFLESPALLVDAVVQVRQAVDGAGLVAAVVGRTGCRHDHLAEPAVERLRPAPAQGAL